MRHTTRFFVLGFVVAAVVLAAHWLVSTPADAVTSDPIAVDSGSAKPFEYFPSQFVMKPAEPGPEIPTF